MPAPACHLPACPTTSVLPPFPPPTTGDGGVGYSPLVFGDGDGDDIVPVPC